MQGGVRMSFTSRATAAPLAGHGDSAPAVVVLAAAADGLQAYIDVGVDVKVILTPPCTFCMGNH